MLPNSQEFADLVISRFLYGTNTPPSNKLDIGLIRPTAATAPPIDVDIVEYMSTVGRFARPSQFPLVQAFFNLMNSIPPKRDAMGNITYRTKDEIKTLLGIGSNLSLSFQEYEYSDNLYNDLGIRTLIWNSVVFSITEDAQFWVDENGQRSIKNFTIVPRQVIDTNTPKENYDLVSSDIFTSIANGVLKELQDPSGIGRTVELNFTGTYSLKPNYNVLDFQNDQSVVSTWSTHLLPSYSAIESITSAQFSSDITRFLDENNKPILYGKLGDSATFADSLVIQSYSYLSSFISNGVVILEDGGNDVLTGSNYDDKLLGGAGDDGLYGGLGNDNLYGGDGDDSALEGEWGDDEIYGELGNDKLDGGSGNDRLFGGEGIDLLEGGAGVRRRNIWHRWDRGLAESGPRLGLDVRRRACGEASGDVRWSFA